MYRRKKSVVVLALLLLLLLVHVGHHLWVKTYPKETLTQLANLADESVEGDPRAVTGTLPDELLNTVSIPLGEEGFTYALYPLTGKMTVIWLVQQDGIQQGAYLLELSVPYRSFFELNCVSEISGRVKSFHKIRGMEYFHAGRMLSDADNTVLDFFTVGHCFGKYSKEERFTTVSGWFVDKKDMKELYRKYGV